MGVKKIAFDTESGLDHLASKMDGLVNVSFVDRKPTKNSSFAMMYGGFPKGKIYTLFASQKVGKSLWDDRLAEKLRLMGEPQPLSMEEIINTEDPLGNLVERLVKLTNLILDEHILQNHVDPRKPELIRLMRVFIKSQPYSSGGEYRFGKLSVFDTGMGITIRLFQPENAKRIPPHDLVYSTTSSYDARRKLKLRQAPMVEGTWAPEFADEALALLRQATVLDQLADVR